jgi:hypothetical protein
MFCQQLREVCREILVKQYSHLPQQFRRTSREQVQNIE